MTQSLSVQGITVMPPFGAFRPAQITTSEGLIETRWYPAPGATSAAVFFGDVGGGFDSPCDDLYDRLAVRLQGVGAASLRVQYRRPTEPVAVGLDGLVSVDMLRRLETARSVAVGWGLGAMAALQAAAQFQTVAAVALLAPYGVASRAAAGLGRPLLVLHGTGDVVAPTSVSRALLEQADEPKRVVYLPGAGHDMREADAEVAEVLGAWLERQLGVGSPTGD
ncbi:MAG: alpha/beta hydrolase [Candidatus Sericytochromatia bacterium]|nr:alpha/beta hydrolase [Candidatus Sericytochromatia bacterium]